ncbi:MAG: ROK family protein, partial [Eubacterium sp.]
SIIYSCDLMPHYTGTPLKKWVENTFNLPCTVENDVNCMGIAESMIGAGRGKKSCFCLTVGTGIGGCMVIDDQVYHGFSNSACEVGYLRLAGGKTFQECAATSVLVEKVAQMRRIDPSEIDGKIIFEQAKLGAEDCISAIDELVESLTEGIAGCVYILNPEIIILGGGITAQHDYLGARIIKALNTKIIESIRCKTTFAFAENGNDAGMIGALLNFQNRIA